LPDGWYAVAVVVISVLTICATLVALFATGERAVRAHAVLIYLLDALRALFRCGGGKR
jgi:Na+/melibiose symporter-like transporter